MDRDTTAAHRDAAHWALQMHGTPLRADNGAPYLNHPVAVSGMVLNAGGSDDATLAGVLVDVLEDTPATPADVEERFGARVREIVEGCTDEPDQAKRTPETWRDRKERYIGRLNATSDPDVLLVALCDTLLDAHYMAKDLNRLGVDAWEEHTQPPEAQRWYYESMLDVFRRKLPTQPLVADLAQAVQVIREFAPEQGHGVGL